MKITRREFLYGTGSLVLVSIVGEEGFRVLAAGVPRDAALNAWIRIAPNDVVTVVVANAEIGQGISTTLPAMLVEELGADWSRVKFESAPAAKEYRNPRANWQFTGNSESTPSYFDLLRTMGASAREMLAEAAAERWGVTRESLIVEKGAVRHRDGKRGARFGELADDAAKRHPPKDPPLKSPAEWVLLGRALPRVDVPAKVDGSAVFGIDFRMPGLLHAAIRHAPAFNGSVKKVESDAVKSIPGVIDVVTVPNAVVVVAVKYSQAQRALAALPVTFDNGPPSHVDSDELASYYRAAMDSATRWNRADYDARYGESYAHREAATGKVAKSITREYESQFLAHAPMEPMNCTARVAGGECDIWAPTQGPELTQITLAAVLGLAPEKIRVHTLLCGGGFGRRLIPDFAVEAALTSRAVGGRPVKVIWSREEEMQRGPYRPATLARITGSLDANNKVHSLAHKLVSPPILPAVFPPSATWPVDPGCCEGFFHTRYDVSGWTLDFKLLKIPIPTMVLRTTGYGPNIFALESFLDELAYEAKRDPLELRSELLAKDLRALAMLDLAAEKSGWRTPLPAGRGRGIAFCDAFGTLMAQVVELSVSTDRVIQIERVTAVVDAGRVLDRGIGRSNIEGGIVWGLSAALKTNITFRDGRPVQSNYHDFEPLRMYEMPPRIDVHFIDSGSKLGGLGELGPVGTPPAVANALFAATGERVRSLPLARHGFSVA